MAVLEEILPTHVEVSYLSVLLISYELLPGFWVGFLKDHRVFVILFIVTPRLRLDILHRRRVPSSLSWQLPGATRV